MPYINTVQERNDAGFSGVITYAPSDTVDIPATGRPCRGIMVTAAATLKLRFADDSEATMTLPVGLHSLRIVRVYATPAPTGTYFLMR